MLLRLIGFLRVFYRYKIWRFLPNKIKFFLVLPAYIGYIIFPWTYFSAAGRLSKEVALRRFLEDLGPIFIKLGQLLSTRLDLLTPELAKELIKLQDKVPPFDGSKALAICKEELGDKFNDLQDFSNTSLAAASIAQVHTASLSCGMKVIVKIRRPDVEYQIRRDCSVMMVAASYLSIFFDSKRFKFKGVVSELKASLFGEMDFMREAASASQIRRNFEGHDGLYVPEIYWDYCTEKVMVQERIIGPNIKDRQYLKDKGVNFEKLALNGIEIFFTQVFEHSFFHADMHPGNIFIDITDPHNPKYQAVDFGIVGSLSDEDKHYLAHNMLAFFERDYPKVARLHIESGWVPKDANAIDFENAIRAVCEPIFKKPLKDISFGQTLLRLFQVATDHKMVVQPQLILLQKTLLAVEGLGRDLYPELDVWTLSSPILKRWIERELGVRAQVKRLVSIIPPALQKAERFVQAKDSGVATQAYIASPVLSLGVSTLVVIELYKLFL